MGDRLANLRLAVERMRERVAGFRLLSAGGMYETEPVDCPDGSMPFYNSVIEIECEDSLPVLHGHLIAIEREMGRDAVRPHHAPRPMDLDVLYAGGLQIANERLTLPHPRMILRRFVLQPLADIRPGLVLPGQSSSVLDLLSGLDDSPEAVRLVLRHWAGEPQAGG